MAAILSRERWVNEKYVRIGFEMKYMLSTNDTNDPFQMTPWSVQSGAHEDIAQQSSSKCHVELEHKILTVNIGSTWHIS